MLEDYSIITSDGQGDMQWWLTRDVVDLANTKVSQHMSIVKENLSSYMTLQSHSEATEKCGWDKSLLLSWIMMLVIEVQNDN